MSYTKTAAKKRENPLDQKMTKQKYVPLRQSRNHDIKDFLVLENTDYNPR